MKTKFEQFIYAFSFHAIGHSSTGFNELDALFVSESDFEYYIKYLYENGYKTITFSELSNWLLRKKEELPRNRYDCIILTQTIHIIDDFFSVVEGVYGMLKKGGVVLATLPSVSRIDVSAGIDGDYWRFTKASAKYLFEKFFKSKNIEIKSYGNAFVCSSFLYGYSHEEIPLEYLEYNDENFPLLITVKAKK